MASRGSGRYAVFGAAFAIVLACDRLTKAWALEALAGGGSISFIPGVLDLHLVHNGGAAFGIGQGRAWVFVAAALVIVAACVAYLVKGKPATGLACALGAVAGGGVGNLVDRVVGGTVTDFLMTTFIDFPVFNVADIAIVCGFVVTFVLLWREAQPPAAAEDTLEGGRP